MKEPPNKRQRRSPFPLGWRDAPKFGRVIDDLIIPMKVPIGNDRSRMLPLEDRFTPELLVQECKRQKIDVGLVIDLTKSTSYYGPEEWTCQGVQHFKIPCQGRGQVPTPAEVNSFCFLVHWWQHQPGVCEGGGPPARKIAVHCTHGFNRSGYMIVHWLMRTHAPLTLPDAVRKFARYREPGIYKKYYIQELFDYFRVDVPVDMEVPKVPAWKAGDVEGAGDSDQDDDAAEEERPPRMDELHATGPLFGLVATDPDNIPLLQHDEVIGEEIMSDEEREIRRAVVALTRGQQVVDAMEEQGRLTFPGSQPVSLARSNVNLLSRLRYWVTWKADGTRYMMLLHHQGTYLIDRAFRVRRFHMRFPTWQEEVDARGRKRRTVYPSRGQPRTWRRHHLTLLDGELVVDQNAESVVPAEQQRRRYLIYDCMLLNGKSLLHLPFKERYKMIDEVTHPRQAERERIATDPSYPWRHCYDAEPFSVRRKDFWPLFQSRMVLEKLIETLSHESDGLIFQPFEGPYDCGTCNELLKWKFAHLNSVDFRLEFPPGATEPELQVLQTRGGPPRLVKVAGARIRLSHEAPTPELLAQEEQVLREAYNGAIMECTYDAELGSWVFHRVRSDKDTPNAQHVYQKVKQSIDDGIDNDEILRLVDAALQSEVYDRDRAKLKLPTKPRPRAPAPPPGPSSVPHRPLGLAPPDG